jgi:hypothetical protein
VPEVNLIYQARFPVASIPTRPFTFVHQLVDIQAGGSTVRFSYGGSAFCTVAGGELAVEKNGIIGYYRVGQSFAARPGEMLAFRNTSGRLGSLQVVVFLPEAKHFTQPYRVY